jgi:hypothetical protein
VKKKEKELINVPLPRRKKIRENLEDQTISKEKE